MMILITINCIGADINEGSSSLITPLCAAAATNRLPIAELLIERGCDITKLTDGRPMYTTVTPLHYAILSRNVQMIKLLLDSGHDPNYPSNYRLYPLIEAIECNCPAIVDVLLKCERCKVNNLGNTSVHCRWGYPPLYQALFRYRRYPIAEMLLNTSKCLLEYNCDSYLSILLCRAFDPNTRCVRVASMLLAAGCDISCTDRFGGAPFETLLNANSSIFQIEPMENLINVLIDSGVYPKLADVEKIRTFVAGEKDARYCDHLVMLCKTPKSLMEQCRNFLRKSFSPYPNDVLKQLILPIQMINFLTLSYT